MQKTHIILGILVGLIVVLLLIIRRRREPFKGDCVITDLGTRNKTVNGKLKKIPITDINNKPLKLELNAERVTDYTNTACFAVLVANQAQATGLKDAAGNTYSLFTIPELTDIDLKTVTDNTIRSICESYKIDPKTKELKSIANFISLVASQLKPEDRPALLTNAKCGVKKSVNNCPAA
jgi:hypothetical protein